MKWSKHKLAPEWYVDGPPVQFWNYIQKKWQTKDYRRLGELPSCRLEFTLLVGRGGP